MNDLFIILLLAISSGLSISITIVVVIMYRREHRIYQNLKQEYDSLWERVLLHAEAMIKRAHDQSLKIIENSELMSADMKEQFKTAFTEAEKRESAEYQKNLVEIQKKITSDSLKQFDAFTSKLIDETKKSQDLLGKKSVEVQAQLDEHLEQRKKELDQLLEQKIFLIVETVLQKVSGQLLTQAQHEELILDALHKAKEEHVL